MAWASKTYTFSPSTTARAAEVNQNFDDMVSQLNTAMPSGGIIAWSGSVASIPSGYYLCDGNNSTPDLRGKFIYGAGGAYAVGASGGEETHVLTSTEMPAHTHRLASINQGAGAYVTYNVTTTARAVGGEAIAESTGGGAAHNNLPPYYALAFIMKS